MRSRPDIDIKIPSSVLPGETLHVDLLVTGRSVTPIDFIAVHFHVTEGVLRPERDGLFTQHDILHETVEVAEAGELGAEVYRYRASFEVSSDLPPTYLGTMIEFRAWVEVHVSIPWWPDVRERYDVTILPAPIDRPAPAPFTGSSLRGNEPFVEVSLRAQSFAPGETIEGAIAFGNLGGSVVQDLVPALVGCERFGEADAARTEILRHNAFLAVSNDGEGREIPFRLAVPAGSPPSMTLPKGSFFWLFEVRLNLGGASDVVYRVPVTIAIFEGRARVASIETAPIGAGRWRTVWAEAGEAAGLAIDRKRLRLVGELSGCDVSVIVGKNEAKRSSLSARLRFGSWGLDLALTSAGVLDLGTYFQDEELERRFRITGRDLTQVHGALVPSLRAALLAFDEVTLGDAEARVSSDAPGYDQPWIGAFLGKVAALAQALDAASGAIPAPEAMTAFLPAWRRFAGDLDGDLCVGNMRITGGLFEGALAAVLTEIDYSEPTATLIELAIDPPLEAAFDVNDAQAVAAAPPQVRALLASIAALCVPILEAGFALPRPPRPPSPSVTPDKVSIRLPVVVANPASMRDLMAELLSLAAALRGERRAGPYR
jgi:hypothetical protein